jgi:hypothetical protein
MKRIDPGSNVDHAFVAAWVEHMKRVYQDALDAYAESGDLNAAGLIKVRNHLRALAMIQKTVAEHHEMERGQVFDAGDTKWGMRTSAVLIKPNGEVIPIKRKETSDG